MDSLKGKAVLLTDALTDVAKVTAEVLAGYGVGVVLCGSDQSALDKLSQQCQAQAPADCQMSVVYRDNWTSADTIKEAIQAAIQQHNKLDAVVYTNDQPYAGTFEGTSPDDITKSLKVLVEPLMSWHQQSIQHIAQAKGSLVVVSSSYSSKISKGNIPYSICKAALDMYTQVIALEMTEKYKGVTANSVNPTLRDKEGDDSSVPVGGVTVKEVAQHIAFLITDEAKFTTGKNIVLDGTVICQ